MVAKRRIYYLLLLTMGIYFMMLYDFQGLRFLIGCAVFIPLICLVILVCSAFFCKVSLEAERDAVSRGEQVRLNIHVVNRSIFPVPRVFLCVCCREQGEKEVKLKKWVYGIGWNREGRIFVEMSAQHCGRVDFAVTRVRIFDYLGIFSLPVRRQKSAEVCVIPRWMPVSLGEIGMSSFASYEKDGDMLLRDFQPGDSLHRVYWKLSIKTDELQVRDFEYSSSVVLFLNFSPEFKKQAKDWDRYLDRAYSTLCFLVDNNTTIQDPPKVIWTQEGVFLEYELPDMEALRAWIYAMLMQEGVGIPLAEEEVLFIKEGLRLEEDCKLYMGEQCMYGYENEEIYEAERINENSNRPDGDGI